VHLSQEIQNRLDILNSNVKLASTIDGTFPETYSFLQKGERQFRIEFASTDKEFSIVLFERTDNLNYENCFARGIFNNLERLASLIDLWVDKQKDILEIKDSFEELELFTDFEIKNSNIEIDRAWTKVKNMFFNTNQFWTDIEWSERYLNMLFEAKKHKSFENYFPFTSHYWLRFSLDKKLTETWILSLYIIATFDRKEKDYYVSFSEKSMSGEFFDTLEEALDFYAEKLLHIKPIKWDTFLTD
jgi:hypothetical protein